jgi:hypothetical protein
LGDEAYWSGTNIGGVLYVLKGDRLLRIGIGGGEDKEMKISKSAALARLVLKRLRVESFTGKHRANPKCHR